jgi:hypothetical protein
MMTPAPEGAIVIDTTSRSSNWSRGLSPFFVGPIPLYDGYEAKNLENAWQFAKVYPHHIGSDDVPTPEYFKWAIQGWSDSFAHRYPMGKSATPKFSWFAGKKMGYIEARKEIYLPLYRDAVATTSAFQKLTGIFLEAGMSGIDIILRDFDGYDHKRLDMSYEDVLNCSTRKMGHAFVLAMMLELKAK